MDNDRGLKLVVTLLPLIAAWLYVIGVAHHQGFLSAYGAHYSLFGLGFEDALLNGAIALFYLSLPNLIYPALLLLMLVIALVMIGAILLNKRPRLFFRKIRKKFKVVKPIRKVEPAVEKALEGVLTANSFLGAFVVVLLLFGLSILVGYKSGQSSARESMKKHSNASVPGLNIEGVRIQIVRCNDEFCLVWDGEASKQVPRAALNNITMPTPPSP